MGQQASTSRRRRHAFPALVVCLVIFGLLNIPVECAVAAGPHSMFLAPEAVADLQENSPPGSAAHTAHDRAYDDSDAPDIGSAMQAHDGMAMVTDESPTAPTGQPHPAMPTPAGFASDAIPLHLIGNPEAGPRLIGPPPKVTTWAAPLLERESAGPEPPPPNLG